jgi:hypothetical protein
MHCEPFARTLADGYVSVDREAMCARDRVEAAAPTAPPAATRHPRELVPLRGLTPSRGSADGGFYVKILFNYNLGRGQLAMAPEGATVYFGLHDAEVVHFDNGVGEIVVEAPPGKVGKTVDVLVIFEPGGESRLEQAFTYVAPRPAFPRDDPETE